jgi:hypothetical protein
VSARRPFGAVRQRGRLFEASYWHGGRRHVAPIRFATKADARAYLSTIEIDIRRGSWIDPLGARMQIKELAERWVESDPTKRESTVVREEVALRLHVLTTLGEHRIDRVGPADVQRLVNA